MKKLKKWLIDHKQTIIIALVALVGGYYMYLTNVSKVFHLNDTYYASDDYFTVVMEFEGDTLSTYLISPSSDTIAVRTDYQVSYRTFTEDILGNFWSDDGIEPLGLRGSDIAGRLYAKCIGSAVWTIDEEIAYYDRNNIHEMEESKDTSYSFGSRFALKEDTLRVYDYAALDFRIVENMSTVEAEIMRLIDSLCPPEF